MATVDKTTGGTAGHPSTRRKPYYVENTVDNSLFDPAATLVMAAGLEVLTASSTSVTFDLGITGSTAGHHDPDCWVDAFDATGTGHAPVDATDAAAMLICKTADTIDILTAGAQDTAGKVRVWAVLCDISGSDETASNSS